MTSESETSSGSELPPELLAKIEQYSMMFTQARQERHDMGAHKYGPGKFLMVNTLEEAAFELIDLANYAEYSFIRLMMLNEFLEGLEQEEGEGKFKRVGEDWGK